MRAPVLLPVERGLLFEDELFVLEVFRFVFVDELFSPLRELLEPTDERFRLALEPIVEPERLDPNEERDRLADERLADERLLRNELPPPNRASAISPPNRQQPVAAITTQRTFTRRNVVVDREVNEDVVMIESSADSEVRQDCHRRAEAVPPKFRRAA